MSRSVLVVDDDVLTRNALVRDFRHAGWDAEAAAGFEEAIRCVDLKHPDLAVIDWFLRPGDPTGLDLVLALDGYAPGTPSVVVSGEPSIPRAVEAMRAGAVAYLEKPTASKAILEAVQPRIGEDHRLSIVVFRHVRRVLAIESGNKTRAANALNISRRGLLGMLAKPPQSRRPRDP